MSKPKHFKPGLYAMFYEQLKLIAESYGYNLLIHGSMSRDLDLVAVPWVDEPSDEQIMIRDMSNYLKGEKNPINSKEHLHFSKMPGGRHTYVIDLNRGARSGEWVRFEDSQYYLDISVVQYHEKVQ